ncbi:glutathione S-transferase-like [Sitodiplosis mosellana]|uniref:glutathione S-transferase-like n=1 Tax=Sitodiplosis mosellana TaxID=263140 RepID=UPI0024439AA3|nr:glutathione S-transferase-like [Sitodiplosis mosellana]
MSQPTYKLYYFDFKALGESIRLLFAYGAQEYEDVRVAKEDWPELKPTMPMGQMPVLEVDGKRVSQSIPIARHIAKRVGLAGDDDWEELLIDSIVAHFNDFRLKISAIFYEHDEDAKAKKLEAIKSDTFILDKLESFAEENNGYLALGKLTWADIYFYSLLDFIQYIAGFDITADRPNLQAVVNNVTSVESIKEYLEKRPETDF